ncbi:PREDICTED: autophagy-related protein 13a-like [Nicotiana attenuata]|uniref:Autophagy-related protein 13a n=1 Tax=Nicotiana attenuata TaxID=49451 RepID=A0A314LA89_NICAT|nr:PREDICTED: autophagy-related protein 13a-like [Nicotiana attenuata]OIT38413.1 autophagy-related protein 13a [Nicotiana attenuata]
MDFQSNPQGGEHGRFEQILSQFLLKSLHIILDSRVPSIRPYGGSGEVKKSDRWFNLVLGDRPAVLDNLNLLHRNLVEPMIIDIILVQDKSSTSLEHDSSTGFAGGYTETVVERWVVQCENRRLMVPHMGDSSFKKTYKKCIILLRSLYSMMRLLPAFKAFRKLSLSSQSCYFDINYKVSSFSEPFSRAEEALMKQYTFIPVDSQQGRLSLSVTYRENLADFNLETSASFPPEIITDYVGSPLTDPMRSFPSTSMDKGPSLRRTQSSSSAPVQRPQSWTSGLLRAPSLPQPYVGSPPLYRAPYELSTSPGDVYGQRVPPNYRLPTLQKETNYDDDQLSPPFSPSPSPSPPTYFSGANPVQTRLRSETGPVSIPHPLMGRSSKHISPNLSDPNRHSLPPMSPRSTKHDSSSHESPSGIRSSRKVDLLRAPESDTGTTNPGQKVSTDARDDSGRFSGLLSSSGSPRVGFSRSSSRLSFQDDLDDCDFSCPFIVDDVDNADSRARQTLDSRKGSDTSSQASATTRKSQDAAVGALVHMLRTAPPLRQDSSCYTSRSVKTEVEGETGTASGFYVPRKASDALEELKTYTQLKDMLLSKSTTRSGNEGGP